VKGHSGDAGNEEADRLANLGIDELPGQAPGVLP
jgi:ribonuclease HI